jgi:hypothetical protein
MIWSTGNNINWRQLLQVEIHCIKYNEMNNKTLWWYILIFMLGPLLPHSSFVNSVYEYIQHAIPLSSRDLQRIYIYKTKRSPYLIKQYVMKAYGVEVFVLNLILRWGWMVSVTLRLICFQRNSPRYPLANKLNISPVTVCQDLPGIETSPPALN